MEVVLIRGVRNDPMSLEVKTEGVKGVMDMEILEKGNFKLLSSQNKMKTKTKKLKC